MKSALISLLIATLFLPAVPAAAKKSKKKKTTTKVTKVEPEAVRDRCDLALLTKVKAAAKNEDKLKLLGTYADVPGVKIRIPGEIADRGSKDGGGNPLCHHEVWNLVTRWEPDKTRFATSDKLGDQVDRLITITKAFKELDTEIEKTVAEAKKALRTGESIGIITIKERKSKVQKRPGSGKEPIAEVDRSDFEATLTPGFTVEKMKLLGDAGESLVGELLADKDDQPATRSEALDIEVGEKVMAYRDQNKALSAALVKFAGVVSSDLVAKVNACLTDVGGPGGDTLRLYILNKIVAQLAQGTKPDDTNGYDSAAFSSIDWPERNRLALYGKQVSDLVVAVDALVNAPGPGAMGVADTSPGGKPAPSGLDGGAASGRIEKFRNAFETKALEQLNAEGATPPPGVDKADLKTAKAYTRGDKVVLITDKGLKVGETPIPASLADDAAAQKQGEDAAVAVAAAFLKGGPAAADRRALTETFRGSYAPGSAGAASDAETVKSGAGDSGCGDKRSTGERYKDAQAEEYAKIGASNSKERRRIIDEGDAKKKKCDDEFKTAANDPFLNADKRKALADTRDSCKAKADAETASALRAIAYADEQREKKAGLAGADAKVTGYYYTEIQNKVVELREDYKASKRSSLGAKVGIKPDQYKFLNAPVDAYFDGAWVGETGKGNVMSCRKKLGKAEPSKDNVDSKCVNADLAAFVKGQLGKMGGGSAAVAPGDGGGAAPVVNPSDAATIEEEGKHAAPK